MRSHRQLFTIVMLLSVIQLFTFEMAKAQNLPALEDLHDVAPAWHPNGSMIAVAQNTSIVIYDSQTLNTITVLNGHIDKVETITWNPSGTQLASGGRDHLIYIWDVTTSAIIQTYNAHTDKIASIDWSPDGSRIVSTANSGDNNMHLWNPIDAMTIATNQSGTGGRIKFSPSGNNLSLVIVYIVALLDNQSLEWQTSFRTDEFGNSNIIDYTNYGYTATWEATGNRFATGNIGGSIYVWDATTLQPVEVLIATSNYDASGITNAGATWVRDVIFGGDDDNRIVSITADGTLKAWSATTFGEIETRQIQPVMAATFSPDGKQLAIIPQGGTGSLMVENTADLVVANRPPIAEAGDPITVSNCDSNVRTTFGSQPQGFVFLPPSTPLPSDPNLRLDGTAK